MELIAQLNQTGDEAIHLKDYTHDLINEFESLLNKSVNFEILLKSSTYESIRILIVQSVFEPGISDESLKSQQTLEYY